MDIPAVPSYSNALKQLILDMLQVDPNKRPSAVDVVHILQSWNGNISSCYPSYNQYTKQPGKQEMFLVAIKYITCVKVPVVESIEEDWAHFGGEEEEEPTLIHVESPVVSKRAEKHIFDLLN